MSKLPAKYQFLDLSDYGRPIARFIANSLRNTKFTPVDVTIAFIISGLIGIYCITKEYYFTAAFFLIFKSILDAADGELARIKKTPSYTGRFLDSVSDIILNLIIFVTLWQVTEISLALAFLAFFGIQLQGTLYNYYYVILRNSVQGDSTSRIFEDSAPKALKGESQHMVNIFYKIYDVLYISFDKIMYFMDKDAKDSPPFPKWFMTILSLYGLGFQLLVMALMLSFNLESYVIPFFIVYSVFLVVFVGLRKFVLK